MSIEELNALNDRDFIETIWGSNILSVIDQQDTVPMSMSNFLSHCIACGGDWGQMLLTGIKKLWPDVYEAIPENMGKFAWYCICTTLKLLGVEE